jgi:hypothetical protein
MIVEGLGEMILDLNMGPLVLERRAAPVQNDRGVWVEQAPTLINVNPVVWHTLEGRELALSKAADMNKEVRRFYARIRFYVSDTGSDIVQCEGKRYRFLSSSDYLTSGGVFFGDAVLEDEE